MSGTIQGWINADGSQQSIAIIKFKGSSGAVSLFDGLTGTLKDTPKPAKTISDPADGGVGISDPTIDSLGNANAEIAAHTGVYVIDVHQFTASTPDPGGGQGAAAEAVRKPEERRLTAAPAALGRPRCLSPRERAASVAGGTTAEGGGDGAAGEQRVAAGGQPSGGLEPTARCARRPGSSVTWYSRCPTGRPGPRAGWVSYERERLVRPNPGIVTVRETDSPTGLPRHAYETPVFAVRPGVAELHWDTWPRIDDAIAGYQSFRALRDAGVIPAHLRFQVGLPFPSSAMNAFKHDFQADYPVAERAFEDLVAREIARLTMPSRRGSWPSSGTSPTRRRTWRACSPGRPKAPGSASPAR